MIYELKNIKKIFGGRTVLDINNLCLEKNKILGLLGPNGAGKSTLLEILAFLEKPDAGEIRFENKKVAYTKRELMSLRRRIVYIRQQPVLFSTTVSKNIELPLKIRKIPRHKRKTIVKELLDLVGMEMFWDAGAFNLSGGETQRIAIAQALACFPEIILMDEPTSSVDEENRSLIERIIGKISRGKKISVIFTTHDMIQGSRLADEIVFLYEGKITESIFQNIFTGVINKDINGLNNCILKNGLKLHVCSNKTGPVRISIDPGKIKLARGKTGSHYHNSLKGTLTQLTNEPGMVRALVDIGIPVSVLIPKKEYKCLNPELGEEVVISFPEKSIKVF